VTRDEAQLELYAALCGLDFRSDLLLKSVEKFTARLSGLLDNVFGVEFDMAIGDGIQESLQTDME